jgi:hypothetical protein
MSETTLHLVLRHKSCITFIMTPIDAVLFFMNTLTSVCYLKLIYTSFSYFRSGIGGSVAFCRPDPKRKLAVAVTLNRLSFDSSKTTGEIVREIFKKLNEPVPLQYAKKNLP